MLMTTIEVQKKLRDPGTSFSVKLTTSSNIFEAISSMFVRTRTPNSHVEVRRPINAHGANYMTSLANSPIGSGVLEVVTMTCHKAKVCVNCGFFFSPVCENNWVRKIARETRAERRRMVELRVETGVQRSLTERLVRSRLQWAGHVERMADDRLPKRAAELREQGRRRRGMPMLRWEDRVKRDMKTAGGEEDWKKKTGDIGGWKGLSDEAVRQRICVWFPNSVIALIHN